MSQPTATEEWKFPESYDKVLDFVDSQDMNLLVCVLLAPWVCFYWNVVCQLEYRTQFFSRLFGSPKVACFLLSFTQIAFSNSRNYYFKETIQSQPQFETPFNDILVYIGYGLMTVGMMFVVTSFLRLGWFGTWHGDHFGIYLDAKVTSFPFNVLDHPMYTGSVLNFLGAAIMSRSITGVLLAFWVQLVYTFTESYVEGPFTDMIYERKAALEQKSSRKSR